MVQHAVFNPLCQVKAVQDDISAKIVLIWLHHTVCTLGCGFFSIFEHRLDQIPFRWAFNSHWPGNFEILFWVTYIICSNICRHVTYQKTRIGTLNSNIKLIFINVKYCSVGKRAILKKSIPNFTVFLLLLQSIFKIFFFNYRYLIFEVSILVLAYVAWIETVTSTNWGANSNF